MRLLKLSFKNLLSNPLNSILSILLLALSVALICFSTQLKTAISREINQNTSDIDMVVGAKGSPLQLILSSVLHIDAPTENIKYNEANKIAKNPLVKNAVPIAYGDSYKGYRIIGSTGDFTSIYGGFIVQGEAFSRAFEVVVGAALAEKFKLDVNDTLYSSHGLNAASLEVHKEHALVVKGILGKTNSVLDRLMVTPLETVWQLHEHHEHNEHHEEASEDSTSVAHKDYTHDETAIDGKEITALLVKFRNPLAQLQLPRQINATTSMQAALTRYQLERLFSFTGIGVTAISWIAVAILLISVFSIFIGLYKIVIERRYELALMYAYGASRLQLLSIVFYEAILLALLGYILGFLFSRLGFMVFQQVLDEQLKFSISIKDFQVEELYLLLVMLALVVFATLLATLPLFKMNVSKILSDET